MDIKTIKNLISLFEASKLDSLDVEEQEGEKRLSVRMEKGEKGTAVTVTPPAAAQSAMPAPKGSIEPDYAEGVVDFNRVADIKSPMVGVFYVSGSPDGDPFVQKGSRVKKGDTLCIIEAMKLMNEVVAERDGEIVEVVAKNGELVEFGQVLFRIF